MVAHFSKTRLLITELLETVVSQQNLIDSRAAVAPVRARWPQSLDGPSQRQVVAREGFRLVQVSSQLTADGYLFFPSVTWFCFLTLYVIASIWH